MLQISIAEIVFLVHFFKSSFLKQIVIYAYLRWVYLCKMLIIKHLKVQNLPRLAQCG
jgi:hypothetical protein